MARHTAEFLRVHSSNLSLHSASMHSSQTSSERASLTGPEAPPGHVPRATPKPPPSIPRPDCTPPNPRSSGAGAESFIAVRTNHRELHVVRDICGECAARLPVDWLRIVVTCFEDSCRICRIRAAKPEAFTLPFCDFLTENPTVFHAVDYFKRAAAATGYQELAARDNWIGKIKPGGKYIVTRNGSALIAFEVGEAYKPGHGFALIAAHIDALTAKLKPVSSKPTAAGYLQLGVAPYAGALNETWWDRDLSIGGRVVVRDPDSGRTSTRLVKLDWPIARIPTLAPHFGAGMMGQGNKQTQMVPIIGLEAPAPPTTAQMTTPQPPPPSTSNGPASTFIASQPPKLVSLIASQLGIRDHAAIANWELELYDSQPAAVGGLDREFIFAGRIDDKLCSWAAFMALLLADRSAQDGGVRMVALFDDEEVGSLLRQGARGNFLPSVVERTVEALCAAHASAASPASSAATAGTGAQATTTSPPPPPPPTFGPGLVGQTLASSFLLSADVTHAMHPNFQAAYEAQHAPRLNVGVSLTADSNGHMTTDGVSAALLDRIAGLGGCALQRFVIRNDSRSGGTVGPALSSALGLRAADAGIPQLSMHSIRATTGALDPGLGVKFFKAFLEKFETVDGEWR